MENKISVKEYLDNKALLRVKNYIPYVNKVAIIDAIMKEVSKNINGTYSLDSVLLDRIKMQIFIESYTNLDLSIMDNELDGYDLLKLNKEFYLLLDTFNDEYKELEEILKLRVNDYIRDKASVKGTLSYKVDHLLDYIDMKFPSIIDTINGIDVQTIISNIANALDKISLTKKK